VKKAIFVFFFVTIAVCLYGQNLTWDLKFLKGSERESVGVSRVIQMETGQPFSFTIKPAANSYCYVILYDSERDITVYDNKHKNPLNDEITFGPWPLSEPSGTETFYVIMSMERQTKLENLIAALKNNPKSQQAADNLYTEVLDLHNKAKERGEGGATPVLMGGGLRGGNDEYGWRYSDKGLYVEPIRIRH
jgi:hypothetical protein